MRRLTFHLCVAVITFVVGTGFHQLVIGLAEVALRSDSSVPEEPRFFTSDTSEEQEDVFVSGYPAVISMADHRDLYIGKEFVGNPDDTRELETWLAKAFAKCERDFMEAQPNRPGRMILLDGCDRMVYIKAATNSSYGDVVKLVESAKRAGARHIRLVADRRKKSYQYSSP